MQPDSTARSEGNPSRQGSDDSSSWASTASLGMWGTGMAHRSGQWYVNHSVGRIVDCLASRFREVRYYGPTTPPSAAGGCDYPLSSGNLEINPSSTQRNSLQALKRPDRLLRHYWRMTRTCDALFLRGSQPLLWTAHWMARYHGKPAVHWVVGNPLAIMKGEKRGYGALLTVAGTLFAWLEQTMLRIAVRVSRAHILANGAELADLFRSRRTHQVVSTTITDDDFRIREDTCNGDSIRLLFVGFIRPEKGLEYLIRALPDIEAPTAIQLAIVGSWDQFPHEHARLRRLAEQLGIQADVTWEGYAGFGADLFDQMDRSDIMVLPSLSEGTPRVLVEARARSLPVVSTNVGGIPSSVTHDEDGLLVPPADAGALASAVSRIIRDGNLRRRLIRSGREKVRGLTVDRFADRVVSLLAGREE